MNTQTLILVLTIIALAILAGLIYLATAGVVIAYVTLAVIATAGLIGLGLGVGIIHQRIAADRQQSDFVANAKENMQLLQQQQRLLNAMNQNSIVRNGHNQPPPVGGNFLIEDGIFDDLDG